jgi:histone chaperone ASF1
LLQRQTVLDNPTCFLNPFQFEITFECLQELDDGKFAVLIRVGCFSEKRFQTAKTTVRSAVCSYSVRSLWPCTPADLEWKVLYVGSAHDSHLDQVLDEILVGPVPVGMNKFVLQADAPAVERLPDDDILGVTVVLVTCSYREREFVRIGYYVNNEYTGEYDPEVGPPRGRDNLDMNLVQRHILAEKPRVTKFAISWGKEEVQQQQQGTPVMPLDGGAGRDGEESSKMEAEGTPSTVGTEMDME